MIYKKIFLLVILLSNSVHISLKLNYTPTQKASNTEETYQKELGSYCFSKKRKKLFQRRKLVVTVIKKTTTAVTIKIVTTTNILIIYLILLMLNKGVARTPQISKMEIFT